MAHSALTPPIPDSSKPRQRGRIRREVRSIWHEAPIWVHCVIVAVGVLLAVAAVLISANWPYRHRKIASMLEDVLASEVTFTGYHRTYFPRPGFVATGITMKRKSAPDLPPLGHVDSMAVAGTWSDLIMLRRRVEFVDITGLHVVVPPIGSKENHEDFPAGSGKDFDGPDTAIEHFAVHNSLLDIMRTNGQRFSFPIKELEIRNLHKGEALTYAVDMQNAIPSGHIFARGAMGPINGADFLSTPVNGNFSFTQVKLSDVGRVSGNLNARGVFKGTLRSMEIETSTDTPDFAVIDGRPTPVNATMQATLAGLHGDLDIHAIDIKVVGTQIHVSGTIQGEPKTTNLDVSVDRGRAEDVMRPFMHDEVPIVGTVSVKGHAYLGPPGDGFIQKFRMTGAFDIPAERVSDRETEKNLSAFSERASGKRGPNTGVDPGKSATEDARDVLSSLKGSASIKNGVASTSGLTFQVAGASAKLAGTFSFHDERVHLTGNLKMDTDISHTATGFKSVLLKPLAPFFKKKNAGAVVPIAVTGLPGHYQVSQDITHTK
jgi:AsmA-like C-terminal region